MEVNIFLNGKLLQRTTDQTSTMSMIMRSPHEYAERESRGNFVHSLMGCLVDRYGKIVAKDEMEFSYDLTNKLLQDVKSFRPPCPVFTRDLLVHLVDWQERWSMTVMCSSTIAAEMAMGLINLCCMLPSS